MDKYSGKFLGEISSNHIGAGIYILNNRWLGWRDVFVVDDFGYYVSISGHQGPFVYLAE